MGDRGLDIAGKNVVVTGAASGIGFAIAAACLAQGGNVVLADIERRSLDAAVDALGPGDHVSTFMVDVRRPEQLNELREHVDATFGGADLLCNNAGVMPTAGLLWETPAADLQWVSEVNLWGVVHGIRAFVPGMLARGRPAHVVNTASMAAIGPSPYFAGYAMTKAAIVSLSATLREELDAVGAPVGVSVLLPEMIRTRLAFAERNRRSGDADFVEDPMLDVFKDALDPATIGARVVDAVERGRFWILPPRDDPFMANATAWMDELARSAE